MDRRVQIRDDRPLKCDTVRPRLERKPGHADLIVCAEQKQIRAWRTGAQSNEWLW